MYTGYDNCNFLCPYLVVLPRGYVRFASCDKRLYVAHAAITKLECVPTENITHLMVRRTVLIRDVPIIAPNVCANVLV